tara:strand:- start:139 stop:948 length:810 start_codon:yes stop_codon:yes gene_type:complete
MGGGGGILSPITDTLFGSPQTVATPDYIGGANQTAANNLAAARAATAANRVNQITPYGNLNYAETGKDQYGNPTWTATQTMTPELQSANSNILSQVGNQYSQAFTGGDLPSYGINPGQNYAEAIMQRLQPQQAMEQKQFDAQMANQGIPVGSEAYTNAARVFQQGQNDKQTSAVTGGMGIGLTANQQQFGQNLSKYQLPMTIASQLKALSTPGYVNPASQQTTAGADIMGAMGLANQNDQANANAANARANATMSGLFSLAGAGINKWG